MFKTASALQQGQQMNVTQIPRQNCVIINQHFINGMYFILYIKGERRLQLNSFIFFFLVGANTITTIQSNAPTYTANRNANTTVTSTAKLQSSAANVEDLLENENVQLDESVSCVANQNKSATKKQIETISQKQKVAIESFVTTSQGQIELSAQKKNETGTKEINSTPKRKRAIFTTYRIPKKNRKMDDSSILEVNKMPLG